MGRETRRMGRLGVIRMICSRMIKVSLQFDGYGSWARSFEQRTQGIRRPVEISVDRRDHSSKPDA